MTQTAYIQERRLVQKPEPRIKKQEESQGVFSHGAVSDYTSHISSGPYWR